uniref:PX domain-containing protein n=1 Tax=Anopheles dirus TaxID=7168 RepID=A0A182NPV0_9DIPT
MPVVAEAANFRQLPAAASLLTAPSTTMAASSSESPGDASIALMEVVSRSSSYDASEERNRGGSESSAALVGDSTFINGGGLLHPWNGVPVPDLSRSPSVGDTFVSAAASSDMPYPSSFCDSTDDSESGPEDEEAEVAERTPYGYITTATITLSGSSIDPQAAVFGHSGDSNANVNGYRPGGPAVPLQPTQPETFLQQDALSPGQEPSSSSGATSISVSIGSAGEYERLVAKQCERYALVQQRAVTERVDVLLEVLHAHSELCERIEKVISEQQRVLAKTTGGDSSDRTRAKTKAPTITHGSTLTVSEQRPMFDTLTLWFNNCCWEDSTERELNEPHVSVKLIAEKKGLFLKHSEYEIKLKGTEKAVRRRYKDFVTLHRYLAEKYPYRLLPTLPPKQLMLDSLLEERRPFSNINVSAFEYLLESMFAWYKLITELL